MNTNNDGFTPRITLGNPGGNQSARNTGRRKSKTGDSGNAASPTPTPAPRAGAGAASGPSSTKYSKDSAAPGKGFGLKGIWMLLGIAVIILVLGSFMSSSFGWTILLSVLAVAVGLPAVVMLASGKSLPDTPSSLLKFYRDNKRWFGIAVVIVWLFGFSGLFSAVFNIWGFLDDRGTEIGTLLGPQNGTDSNPLTYEGNTKNLIFGNKVDLTNNHGWWNYWVNPNALDDEKTIYVYRGREEVSSCEANLSMDIIEGKKSRSGPVALGTTMVLRQGVAVATFENVVSCQVILDGGPVDLIYPGNVDPTLNKNGKGAAETFFKVKSVVGGNAHLEGILTDPCLQGYGERIVIDSNWKRVEVYPNRYEFDAQPNQDYAEVRFMHSSTGGWKDGSQLGSYYPDQPGRSVQAIEVRSKDGSYMPFHYRNLPLSCRG